MIINDDNSKRMTDVFLWFRLVNVNKTEQENTIYIMKQHRERLSKAYNWKSFTFDLLWASNSVAILS